MALSVDMIGTLEKVKECFCCHIFLPLLHSRRLDQSDLFPSASGRPLTMKGTGVSRTTESVNTCRRTVKLLPSLKTDLSPPVTF